MLQTTKDTRSAAPAIHKPSRTGVLWKLKPGESHQAVALMCACWAMLREQVSSVLRCSRAHRPTCYGPSLDDVRDLI